MEPDFSFLFHQSSKNLSKGHPPIAASAKDWPKEWRTVSYKGYPRFPKISLPATERTKDLFEAIRERRSRKRFDGLPLSLEEISLLLQYSCGNIRLVQSGRIMHRAQPSGGERYPIEVYPLVLKEGLGIKPGLYHYNVKIHALDVLWEHSFLHEEIADLFTYDWVQGASCVFFNDCCISP